MRKQPQDQREWHRVFAWWPVVTQDGLRVWLEPVERRYWGSSWFDDYFHYRLPAQGMQLREDSRSEAEAVGLQPGPAKQDAP
jgi:hypothetical protein